MAGKKLQVTFDQLPDSPFILPQASRTDYSQLRRILVYIFGLTNICLLLSDEANNIKSPNIERA